MDMKHVRLADCCTIKPPKSEAKKRLNQDNFVSFVPMNNLGINTKELTLNETKPLSKVVGSYTYFADNDVLLAKITPCFENGKLGIARGLTNGIGFGSSEFIVFRPSEDLLPDYLYYYLLRPIFRESGQAVMTGAVGHKRVPKEYIDDTKIPLPSIEEQKRIVTLLDKAFAEIEQARALAEKNLNNARELFESYLQQVFSQRGEGWVNTSIECLVNNGLIDKPLDGNHGEIHPKKADFVEEGVPFIMASDLIDGEVDTKNCSFITRQQADTLRKGFAKDGDVLISHKATIGRTAILKTGLDYVMLTPQVTYYRVLDESKLTREYLYWYLNSPLFLNEMKEVAGVGSTRSYIGITKQRKLKFYFPDIDKQKDISQKLGLLDKEIKRIEPIYARKLEAYDELKKSILQQAFSGQLTSKDVA